MKKISLGTFFKKLGQWAGKGWYFPDDPSSKDRVRLLGFNYSANIITNLIGGSFFTGLLILMNASDSFMGAMTMITTGANLLQLVAPLLLERFEKRRTLIVWLRALSMLFNILFIGIIPLFPMASQSKLVLVAFSVLMANLSAAVVAPALTVWHLQSIPSRVRNQYFSLISMTVGAVVALMNLGASRLVDFCREAGSEYVGLLILRGICLILAVVESWNLFHIREYAYERSEQRFTLKYLLLEPFHQPKYLKTVLVAFLWNMTCNLPGPYFTVYMLKNMSVSYTYLMLINLINVPVIMFLTPIWSRVVRRFSWFKSLYLAMGLYLLYYVGLAFVTPSAPALYPIAQIYSFCMMAGISLCFTNVPYVNIPQKNQTVYIGFYSTMANLGALLGVTIGQQFIAYTEEWTINLLGVTMINKQILMLLTALLMLGATLAIRCIQKSLGSEES